jgi:hypothetical protein
MHAQHDDDDEDTGPRHARLALLCWQRVAACEASIDRATVMLREAQERLYRSRESRRPAWGG